MLPLLLLAFLFACGSDEETDADLIKKYERYLIGTWIQVENGKPIEKNGVIEVFNNNRTGNTYVYETFSNNVYKIKSTIDVYNVRVVRNNNLFEIWYEYKANLDGEEKEWGAAYAFDYMDNDSIAYQIKYGNRLIMRKVPSINIAE